MGRGTGISRRRALGCTAGATVTLIAPAGCGLFDTEPQPPPGPDPLQPILDEALALAAAMDQAAAAQPALAARLTPLAADHRAHAAELARVIGTTVASPAPGGGSGTASVAPAPADLRTAEQDAARTATAAARVAPPERVGLLGSIAACRASHVEALRS